jgi:hypothetical protein
MTTETDGETATPVLPRTCHRFLSGSLMGGLIDC